MVDRFEMFILSKIEHLEASGYRAKETGKARDYIVGMTEGLQSALEAYQAMKGKLT